MLSCWASLTPYSGRNTNSVFRPVTRLCIEWALANRRLNVRIRTLKSVDEPRSYRATGHRMNINTLPNQTVPESSMLIKMALQEP